MIAQSIEDVLAALDTIVSASIAGTSRLGYFAALYSRVTTAIYDAIASDAFDDGDRMERLDVLFANRYLAAYEQYRRGELPSRSWLLAFTTAERDDTMLLQQLLVAMNAHINLDLGIAAARTAPGSEIGGLKRDFERINDILTSLTPSIDQDVAQSSSVFRRISAVAPTLEVDVTDFVMRHARDGAWKLATRLAPLPLHEQLPEIAHRDNETHVAGEAILRAVPFAHTLGVHENGDVAATIRQLADGTMVTPPAVPVMPATAAPRRSLFVSVNW